MSICKNLVVKLVVSLALLKKKKLLSICTNSLEIYIYEN